MPAAPRYSTVEQVRLDLRAPTSVSAISWTDATYTATLTACIAAADSLIDDICGWPFDVTAGAVTRRVYPVRVDPHRAYDIATHSRVSGDYGLVPTGPVSSASMTLFSGVHPAGLPPPATVPALEEGTVWEWHHVGSTSDPVDAWRHIRLLEPVGSDVVSAWADWGWREVPPVVNIASRRWAVHIFKQLSSPLGAELLGDAVVRMYGRPAGIDDLLAPVSNHIEGFGRVVVA